MIRPSGLPSDEIWEKLAPEDRELFDWFYDATNAEPRIAVFMWGLVEAVWVEHPDWTLWKLVREARRRLIQ